jgi:NAD-dependent DNA ligase
MATPPTIAPPKKPPNCASKSKAQLSIPCARQSAGERRRYDRLFRRLVELEKNFPISPRRTRRRSSGRAAAGEVHHRATLPMLSLNNAMDSELQSSKNESTLLKHSDAIEYAVEPKIDGLAIELVI